MNYGMIGYVLSNVVLVEGLFLMLPAAVGLGNGEMSAKMYLFVAIGCIIAGVIGRIKKPQKKGFFALEGLITVAVSWIVMSLIGALAFYLTGEYPSYIDCLFECVSGFTTTGAGVLPDIEILSKCNLFWRGLTHWIGGMGVLVFVMAVIPLSGGNAIHMMRAESPGPEVSKIVPRVRKTAAILYGIYIAITVIMIAALLITKVPLFEAAILSFSTVGTGGFAVYNSSIAAYSLAAQIVIIVFMLICSINFYIYFLLVSGKVREAFKNEEVKVFFVIVAAATLIIGLNTIRIFGGFGKSLYNSLFTVSSLISTTGFGICDFNYWPSLSKSVIIIIMFIGACAGSTGGGLKVSRIIILGKAIRNSIISMTHPRSVKKVSFNGRPVSDSTVKSVMGYFALYMGIMLLSVLVISIDDFDLVTNFTSVLTTMNNVGPGLNIVGPMGNFSTFSDLSKIVLTLDMLIGRLELFPIIVLFVPRSWKRK